MAELDPIDAPTLTAGVRAGVQRWPGSRMTFVVGDVSQSFSLTEIHLRAKRLAGGLAGLGLVRGDVIAMQLPNRVEAVVTCVAALELGLTIAPIAHVYGKAELDLILDRSSARALVIPDRWRDASFPDRVNPSRRRQMLDHVIVVGEAPEGCVAWGSLDDLRDHAMADAEPDERALLLYTSGTTGSPKGVTHTQRTLVSEVAQMIRFNDGEEGDVTLVSFPIGHMAGVLGAMRAFFRHRHTIFMDTWDPAVAAHLVATHGVTNTAGTPFHLLALLEAADRAGLPVSSIRSYLLGATAISPELIAAADARGIRAFRCYGSTEQPTVSCGRPSDSFADRASTDGRLLPGVEVRIVDADERDVPYGNPGEILSRGVDLSPGYTDPELDAVSLTEDGWYRSGDIGMLDDRGYLTITDRKKDIIIRAGENIASKEVEDSLMSHPSVREVAVVGIKDPRYGERVCAVVVLAGGAAPVTLAEMRAHVLESGLARPKAPESLFIATDLPRTPSGKVQKQVLRDALSSGSMPSIPTPARAPERKTT
ncbi:MAG: fadK [Ilumatobacteraceae bacterium]|nr:fadK [Ilumatobacteraceae bacterium]